VRVVAGFVAFMAVFALAIGGLLFTLVGIFETVADAQRYDVQFGSPGDECEGGRLKIDVEDGARLWCGVGVPIAPPDDPPPLEGFSQEQMDDVLAWSERYGEGGLTEQEQEQLQGYVDRIAETVPPVEEKFLPGPSGVYRILLGVAAMGVVGLVYLRLR
jgi:hypothetical protein